MSDENVRYVLPTRRAHTVATIEHAGVKYHVGFGQECDREGVITNPRVLEVFADSRRTGSDQEAILHDACIAMSLLIQYGCPFGMQAAAYGEIRNEGEESGPPASILGAIARMALEIEKG